MYMKSLNRLWDWVLRSKTTPFMCGNKMPTRCNRSFYCGSYF